MNCDRSNRGVECFYRNEYFAADGNVGAGGGDNAIESQRNRFDKNMTDKLIKILGQWPVVLVGCGLALTLVWTILLFWFPLRLFEVL